MKAAPKVNVKTRATSLLARIIFGYIVCAATFSFAQGEWTAKSDMPTARFGLSAEAVNGKIYAIGGANASSILGMVEEYDPATDTWSPKTDMPTIRKGMATSVVNGKIYVFGGSNLARTSLATVEEYDPATDTWTAKSDMSFRRSGSAAVTISGKIYVIGGWGLPHGDDSQLDFLSAIEVYDPATDIWQQHTDAPSGNGNFGFTSVNGKIYVVGGTNPRSETWEYDPATEVWTAKAAMIFPSHFLSASNFGGKLYAIGGSTEATEAVRVYDPELDTWNSLLESPMPTARGSLATAIVDGKIYAIGGHTGISWGDPGIVYSTVEEKSLQASSTAVTPQSWGQVKALK